MDRRVGRRQGLLIDAVAGRGIGRLWDDKSQIVRVKRGFCGCQFGGVGFGRGKGSRRPSR